MVDYNLLPLPSFPRMEPEDLMTSKKEGTSTSISRDFYFQVPFVEFRGCISDLVSGGGVLWGGG